MMHMRQLLIRAMVLAMLGAMVWPFITSERAEAWGFSLQSFLQGSLWCLQMRMQQHSTHPTVCTVLVSRARSSAAAFMVL